MNNFWTIPMLNTMLLIIVLSISLDTFLFSGAAFLLTPFCWMAGKRIATKGYLVFENVL